MFDTATTFVNKNYLKRDYSYFGDYYEELLERRYITNFK